MGASAKQFVLDMSECRINIQVHMRVFNSPEKELVEAFVSIGRELF